MPSKARKKAIRLNAQQEAERRNIPAKKLQKFMDRKIEIDTKLNDQIDDLLDEFKSDIAPFVGGHVKFNPSTMANILGDHTAKMKAILTETAMLFASLGESAYKVIVYDAMVKGLGIVKDISVEMNSLRDEMENTKKQ